MLGALAYSRAPVSAHAVLAICLLAVLAPTAGSQAPASANVAPVRGIFNFIHTTGDAERAFAFYRDVFEITLEHSPFAPLAANAPPPRIRTVDEARSDVLVWDLTDTHGSRFRTVFMHATNTPFGLELSEFFDLPRLERPPNPWDIGASTLIFSVRDLDAVTARLHAAAAPVVTLGGAQIDTPGGRALLVRDPDGYLVQVVQGSRAEIARATSPGTVIGTSIGITVSDTAAALAFYRHLLGFEIRGTERVTADELRVQGLASGTLTRTTSVIPGAGVVVVISEFELADSSAPPSETYRWRIQDVGAPQFQLEVTGLDALLERTIESGYSFLSIGGRPIERPFGRFVFVRDADGIPVEFVEPTLPR